MVPDPGLTIRQRAVAAWPLAWGGQNLRDILITLGKQYHLIRPLSVKDGLFAYLVLDKAKSNLALARLALGNAEKALVI